MFPIKRWLFGPMNIFKRLCSLGAPGILVFCYKLLNLTWLPLFIEFKAFTAESLLALPIWHSGPNLPEWSGILVRNRGPGKVVQESMYVANSWPTIPGPRFLTLIPDPKIGSGMSDGQCHCCWYSRRLKNNIFADNLPQSYTIVCWRVSR